MKSLQFLFFLIIISLLSSSIIGSSLVNISFQSALEAIKILNLAKTPILNSIIFGISVATISSIIGTSLFWIINFHIFPLSNLLKYLIYLPILIPIYISGYATAHFFENTAIIPIKIDFHNFFGAILVASFNFYPYIYMIINSSSKKINNIIIISRLNGASSWKIYKNVIFSAIKPSVIFSMTVVFIEAIGEYGMTNEYGINNLTNFIYKEWFYKHNYSGASIINILVLFLVVFLLIIEEKQRKKLKYNQNPFDPKAIKFKLSTKKKILVLIYIFIVFSLGFLIPVLEILKLSMGKFFTIFSGKNFPNIINLTKNSLETSSIIAILTIVFGYTTSYLLQKKQILLNLIRNFSSLSYGIPGTFSSINLISWFNKLIKLLSFFFSTIAKRISFIIFGSKFGIVIGLSLRFFNLAINNIISNKKMEKKEIKLVKSIFSCNDYKNKIKNFFWLLPSYSKEIIILFLLIFIESIKELPITLIIRPFNYENLTIKLFNFVADERYQEASVFSVILVGILCISSIILTYLMSFFEKKR